jgi:putative oxidoreductase
MTALPHSALADRAVHASPSPLPALLTKALATQRGSGAAVARMSLGLILLPHGLQHDLGWFGGYGFAGTLGWMTKTLGLPAPLAVLGLLVELVAPALLVVGFGGRVTALAVLAFMAFAASTHLQNGFFMNWFGSLPSGQEGFEYHLLTLALAAVVALEGMGGFSLDRALFGRRFTSAAS